jgi:CDGSH-type Zn-finger protein
MANGDNKNRKPRITIVKNGPYMVSGVLPLAKEVIVTGPDGNPVRWSKEGSYTCGENYSLCRCGRSNGKPFCDGTHVKAGFDGTETASRKPYKEQSDVISGPAIILNDAQELCAGARFCHRAGGAWKLAERSKDRKSVDTAVQEACDCPSGRLVACDRKTGKVMEPSFEPSISIVEDPGADVSGPIWVKGGVEIESSGGSVYEVRNRVTLCRCGRSGNKPFCDASHIDVKFNDGDTTLVKKKGA